MPVRKMPRCAHMLEIHSVSKLYKTATEHAMPTAESREGTVRVRSGTWRAWVTVHAREPDVSRTAKARPLRDD